MDNVNHLNELSIQSQLSILEKLVADAEQSTDARRDFEAQPRAVFQKYGITDLQIKAGNRKVSLYELVESTGKEARVPVARAVYRRIQLAYYDEDNEAEPQTIPLVKTALSKSHPNDSRLLRRWQPTWPLDPLKHPSYESRSIGCAPLSDDAQPISFPPRFTEPDSHLIVGTGFQNARFRIQNHFFCLGGRPTIFVV